jgi:hypothetical protein
MKTKKVKPRIKKTPFTILPKVENQSVLAHVLSPLEMAAWHNQFQPFTYLLNGISVTIEADECLKLLKACNAKIEHFTDLIYQTSKKIAADNSAEKKRFFDAAITAHQLPVFLLNILRYRYNCNNMFDVLRVGKLKLQRVKGIGKMSVKKLETLFEIHDCEHLF